MLRNNGLKVLVLGLNYAPEMVGIAVYTTGLAEELVKHGHQVSVVAGKPYYPDWKVPDLFRGSWSRRTQENGVDLTRVMHYVPANPTGARRILHHVSLAISSAVPFFARAIAQRPDVVITVAPSLIAAPVAWLASRLTGARNWLHIQDFEVEAAIATGLVGGRGPGARLAQWFESFILRRFDRVSSISPAMCRKCVEKGVEPERVVEFRNWADIDGIKPLDQPSPFREEWGINEPYVALYSGNIANKQGIEIITSVAERLKHRRDLLFVVCGNGPNRTNLEMMAKDLSNIRFFDLQPVHRLSDLLGIASVHLLVQRGTAADLMLPSKMANMMASGRSIVATAHVGTGIADEIEGCGLLVPPDDPHALARALESLLDDETLKASLGRTGRARAEERWAKAAIILAFEQKLLALLAQKRN